jgi:hypothetical protein
MNAGLFTAAGVGIAAALLISLHHLVFVPLVGQWGAALLILPVLVISATVLDRLGFYGQNRRKAVGMRLTNRRKVGSLTGLPRDDA